MPIYEYECRRCGHDFETIQKFSDKPLRKCPECGRLSLRKKVSVAAFHLKGSGWYVTDFRDKGAKATKGNGEAKAAAPAKDGTKAEPKKTEGSGKGESKASAS